MREVPVSVYRISGQPQCLCLLLLELIVGLGGRSTRHTVAGDAVVGWAQPKKADLRNLFPLGRTNYYWHSVSMADWRDH